MTAWPLYGDVQKSNYRHLQAAADRVHAAGAIPETANGDHVLFYMNDYTTVFGNFSGRWQRALHDAASVQIVFNRTIGGLHHEHWLSQRATRVYFHDSLMLRTWKLLTEESPLAGVPAIVMAPPVDVGRFFPLAERRPPAPPVVIGRLAGDTDVPGDAASIYGRLAELLPDARFWFMPAPAALREAFGPDERFRFLDLDAMSVDEFLAACHVYALTYSDTVPVPGPRSLIEAMAAGCAPVTIDRHGPRDRIVHDESGLLTNDGDEMIDCIVRLATDASLRERIAAGAVKRAREFDPEHWVAAIVEGAALRS